MSQAWPKAKYNFGLESHKTRKLDLKFKEITTLGVLHVVPFKNSCSQIWGTKKSLTFNDPPLWNFRTPEKQLLQENWYVEPPKKSQLTRPKYKYLTKNRKEMKNRQEISQDCKNIVCAVKTNRYARQLLVFLCKHVSILEGACENFPRKKYPLTCCFYYLSHFVFRLFFCLLFLWFIVSKNWIHGIAS